MKFQDCHHTALNTSTSIFQANLTTTVSYTNTTFTETGIYINGCGGLLNLAHRGRNTVNCLP